jgi:hypothetical protein
MISSPNFFLPINDRKYIIMKFNKTFFNIYWCWILLQTFSMFTAWVTLAFCQYILVFLSTCYGLDQLVFSFTRCRIRLLISDLGVLARISLNNAGESFSRWWLYSWVCWSLYRQIIQTKKSMPELICFHSKLYK